MGNTTTKLFKIMKLSVRFGIDAVGAGVAVNVAQKAGVQNQYALAGIACTGGGLSDMLVGKPLTDKAEAIITTKIADKNDKKTDAQQSSPVETTASVSADIVRGNDAADYLKSSGVCTDFQFENNHLYRFYTVNGEVMMDDLGEVKHQEADAVETVEAEVVEEAETR